MPVTERVAERVAKKRVAIVGAGWAGLSAALQAVQNGHQVTLLEAAHACGGRARSLASAAHGTGPVGTLDNGQHILIGAYRETLRLLAFVGVDTDSALLRLPLTLEFPDRSGLRLPAWPAPLDALGGLLGARGWSASDKWSLLRATVRWQRQGFRCAAGLNVLQVCAGVRPRVLQTLIEPLCVSALNTPAAESDAQVFLRVLQDSLFGGAGASHLLLPRTDLSALFVQPALRWLQAHGAQVRTGARASDLAPAPAAAPGWTLRCASDVHSTHYDAVILACPAAQAARLLLQRGDHPALRAWAEGAAALRHEAIATVYLQAPGARLRHPMLALHSSALAPAQFAFDRGQLGGPPGLLALVVSACRDERTELVARVLQQAQTQLAGMLGPHAPVHLQTVLEKRATFACTPGLRRPAMAIAPGLLACGDYVAGPYPATLEGAVRSGGEAANLLENSVE